MCTRKASQNFCFIFKRFYTFCNIPLPFTFHFLFPVFSASTYVFKSYASQVHLPNAFRRITESGISESEVRSEGLRLSFLTPNRRSEGSGLRFSIAKYDCFRGRQRFRTLLWSVKWRRLWTIRKADWGVATEIFGSQRATSRLMFEIFPTQISLLGFSYLSLF